MASVLAPGIAWQPSLLDEGRFDAPIDVSFPSAGRRFLGAGAWLDLMPGAITAPSAWFDAVLDAAPWAHHQRRMYEGMVDEPRLTTRQWDEPPGPVRALASALSHRYGLDLGIVSGNLYRDGKDSVAWHGDRVGRTREQTVVAILSLGAPRRFLLRPKGGGASVRLAPEPGDLLVMGGTCQRTWEHSVPKCASSAPRISVMFREAY
jgi:alkylated DNA repair dioxygenase AlkB